MCRPRMMAFSARFLEVEDGPNIKEMMLIADLDINRKGSAVARCSDPRADVGNRLPVRCVTVSLVVQPPVA